MNRASDALFLAIACMGLVASPGRASAAAPEFVVRECLPAASAAGAQCGVVHVPENHANPRGRKIGLNIIVLPDV